jgi:hypothetical protein
VTSIVLYTLAALVSGLVLGSALSRWQPAFPALFFAGVLVFLVWSVFAIWDDNGLETGTGVAGLLALLGWIVGIVGGIGVRRQRRRTALQARNLRSSP